MYLWYAIALVGSWFVKKDINTIVSIYFLGYLIWTSAVTWHKVTRPKTSECKYTNNRNTLKISPFFNKLISLS